MRHAALRITDLLLFCYACLFGFLHGYRKRAYLAFLRNQIFSYSNAKLFREFGRGASISSNCILKNPQYVSIGEEASVGERTVITAWDIYENEKHNPEISIGRHSKIGADCHITAVNKILIGNGVLFGKSITVSDNSHGATTADQLEIEPAKRRLVSKGAVIIEDNVWIGDKATILPGVRIGKGSIIAANAVVTKHVPAGSIAAGNPARVVKNMLKP